MLAVRQARCILRRTKRMLCDPSPQYKRTRVTLVRIDFSLHSVGTFTQLEVFLLHISFLREL